MEKRFPTTTTRKRVKPSGKSRRRLPSSSTERNRVSQFIPCVVERQPQSLLPMEAESLATCFQQLGVDAIANLKCNSIRELHRFHVERRSALDWKAIACQNNGLLLYAIASQFLNPRACYEELVACCEELLCFHSFVNIVMPIFLDEQLGGVTRVNQCFTFLFSTLRRDEPSTDCDPSVYAWYECAVCYLPFSSSLLQQMQLFFASFPSPSLLRCMICLAQNNVHSFLQSVAAPDALSSTLLSLLNETPFVVKWKVNEE